MKKSFSSIHQPLLHTLITVSFIIIVTITTSSTIAGKTSTTTTENHPHRRHQLHDHNSCITISTHKYPSPLCNSDCHPPHHHHRKPPLPPPEDDEIDPRYGVSKRLVPSGPNPLHN
ncbi:hypothetical protein QVD17_31780 [Tagetes erecta]|uniref:CLAVATA3/ESR (CLE)-related protein 9 n=1 Tax=Tagetes erecta TaxID=13708 RepID=A0AAD8K8E9_TARER|nr:hypothetical protein QVD17_31780 [Tagetes erecta]